MPISRYGGRRGRVGAIHVIAAVLASGAVAAFLVYNFVEHRRANVAIAEAWRIEGPPCPSLSEAAFTAQGYKALKSFDYDDIVIARHAGAASCQDLKRNGGTGLFHDQACQFTGPATLIVTTKKGRFFYVPGAGRQATLYVHEGVPRCVLGGNFTLQSG